MKLSLIAFASLVAFASGGPVANEIAKRQAPAPPTPVAPAPALCSGTTGTRQCCATDVLGLADLDCADPKTRPTSFANFTAMCAGIGQRARCCAIPILGQALICGDPVRDAL
jgi:hypothetical protein